MIQIIEETYNLGPFGIRGYDSHDDRLTDMEQLRKRGINYFIWYHDTQSRYAMQYAVAGWVTRDAMLNEWSRYGIYDQNQRSLMQGPFSKPAHPYIDR